MEAWRGIVEHLARGGWIMVPLGICSLALWTLVADRWLALRTLGREDTDLTAAVNVVRGAAPVPEGEGLRARLVRAFLDGRTGRPAVDLELLRHEVARLRPELRRGIAFISVLAAVAPLLGLLGTVTGMVRAFDVIAVFGTGNARELAGGLSQALVTTQSGLLVAIPGLMFGALLSRRARRLDHQLTETLTVLERTIEEREAAA